ncbi:FAD-dependent oxidoreductase [Candidatus Margulisiibacteriota bacterium]
MLKKVEQVIPSQHWNNRLDNKTPIDGLFLTGHWTKPSTTIPPVINSGKMAAKLVLENLDYGIIKK